MFDIALGEILNGVPEPSSKRIVGAYKHTVSYAKNMAKINCSAFTYSDLEKCAISLKVTSPSQESGAKLFDTKKKAADLIILKIETHFDQTCDECEEKYRNKFGDAPTPLHCFLCMQGSHHCTAITEKMQGYTTFAANKPAGIVWICRGCRLKNSALDCSKKKKKKTVKPAPNTDEPKNEEGKEKEKDEEKKDEEEEEEEEEGEEEDEENNEDRPSPRRDGVPATKGNDTKMCFLFTRNQCPHGPSGKEKKNGKVCPDRHPRKCIKFCRYGNKKGRGCQLGRSCPYFHPVLCHYSSQYGGCTKRECTFTHLRHTKRPPFEKNRDEEEEEKEKEKEPQRGRRNSNYSNYGGYRPPLETCYEEQFPKLPRKRLDSVGSVVSLQSDPYRNPFPRFTPTANAPPPAAQSSAEDRSGVSFLAKLIENLKASFEKDISEIRARLPPLEKQQQQQQQQLPPQEHLQPTQFRNNVINNEMPQMQHYPPPPGHPALMYHWNRYQGSMY